MPLYIFWAGLCLGLMRLAAEGVLARVKTQPAKSNAMQNN